MFGKARKLAIDIPLPDGVSLRRVTAEADVLAMEEMQGEVFDDPDWRRRVGVMMRRLASIDGMELWVVRQMARSPAGRTEPVHGTDFADLCGGATRSSGVAAASIVR